MRIFLRVWENKFERINKIKKKYCLNNNINLKKIYSGANDKFVVWVNSKIIKTMQIEIPNEKDLEKFNNLADELLFQIFGHKLPKLAK